jgi:hypothetical protein
MFPEKEASKKWCPFARLSEDGNHGYNRVMTGMGPMVSSGAKCIGGTCAAWRWKEGGLVGYCGLVGKT